MRDKSGKLIGASKVGRDITERKQYEKMQQLLVGELNHRVKNTLATVQSIANQTVYRAQSPSEFAASFGGRIQALARTHGLLTDSTWQGAELTALIRDIVSGGEVEADQISYSGPVVMLNAQAALHLSLVLHELTTNARKYGALSNPHGHVSIRWAVRTGEGRQLLLQWQERGGPVVTVPQKRGFGTTLVERSLEAHGGKASIRYDAEGVTCDIALVLPEGDLSVLGSYRRPVPPAPEPLKNIQSVESKGIAGKRILVVDDEPLIALDIVSSLTDEGCTVVGPAATIEKALALIASTNFDAALLDANLAGDPVDSLAAALTRRGIPFAFVSGYGREGLPEAFRQATLIRKPFQRQRVIDVVRELTGEPSALVQVRSAN